MKQIAVLFDAIRNERFAIAVKSGDLVTYYGAEGQAREWSDWANSSIRNKSAELPTGVIVGPYRDASSIEIDKEIEKLGYSDISEMKLVVSSKSYKIITSIKTENTSKVPAICDTPMFYFKSSQYSQALNYKALAFRCSIKEASALYEARTNNYVYSDSKSHFIAQPNSIQEKTLRPRFEKSLSRGIERRLGKKILSHQNSVLGREKIGVLQGMETKSADFDFKSIGQRIGGGTRAARRAGRFASATFDPNAWDGDGDGIVQEGTPFQRPAIPGVNDRSTRGRVDVSAATQAWEAQSAPERGSVQRSASRQRMDQARVSQVERGMSSRSERAKQKSKRRAIPGKDKVAPNDGQWWQQLNDDQKSKVEQNLRARLMELESFAKGSGRAYPKLKNWWDDFLDANGEKKDSKGKVIQKGTKDPDGNVFTRDSRIRGAALQDLGTEVFDLVDEIQGKIDAIKIDTTMSDEDKAKKIKPLSAEIQKYQRLLDDIKTLEEMEKMGDFSLLEHLHPGSRQSAIGKVGKGVQGFEKVEGNIPAGIADPKVLSTIHGRTGGAVVDETKVKKKKRDPKLRQLVRRLSEENPERARRRAMRRARKAGANVGGFGIDAPVEKGTKKRIKKAIRQLNKRKTRDTAEALQKDLDKNKASAESVVSGAKAFVEYDAEGNLKVTKQGLAAMLEAERIYKKERKPKSTKEVRELTFMASLWDAIGYNGTPFLVKDDEVQTLVDAGWEVIHRGHGREGFAEEWLANPKRFITGQGGEAYGAGEYWAYQGNWTSWLSNSENSSTVGFVSPNMRIMKASEVGKAAADNRALATLVDDVKKIMGGKEAEMDPAEFIRELKNILAKNPEFMEDSAIWSGPIGQMYAQIFQMLEGASGSDAQQLFSVMAFLRNMVKSSPNGYAALLGYDAIDTGGKGSPLLIMNRSAVAALGRPVKAQEAISIGKTPRVES